MSKLNDLLEEQSKQALKTKEFIDLLYNEAQNIFKEIPFIQSILWEQYSDYDRHFRDVGDMSIQNIVFASYTTSIDRMVSDDGFIEENNLPLVVGENWAMNIDDLSRSKLFTNEQLKKLYDFADCLDNGCDFLYEFFSNHMTIKLDKKGYDETSCMH